MASMLSKVVASLIREEESLNSRYYELADTVDNPEAAEQFRQFGSQGYDRIQKLYSLWKSIQENKP